LAEQRTDEKRQVEAPGWKADVQLLCAELERAIAALAADDLESLKAGIPLQEEISERLQSWAHTQAGGSSGRAMPARKSLPAEFLPLVKLTRLYSALLKRSMRSTNLRAALCETYRQSFSTVRLASEISAGLSCEV
jgi:hypothetical protein